MTPEAEEGQERWNKKNLIPVGQFYTQPPQGEEGKVEFKFSHRRLCAGRHEPTCIVNMKHCYDNRLWTFLNYLHTFGLLWCSDKVKLINKKS